MYRYQPHGFKTRLLWRVSSLTPNSASCYSHTSSNVRPRDFDTLAKSLKGYSIFIHIFHPALWLCRTLGRVYLRHSNITYVESKLVSPHTLPIHACSIVCDTTTLHLIVISVSNNTTHASWCNLMSRDSSIILVCPNIFVEIVWLSGLLDLGFGSKGYGFKSCNYYLFSFFVKPQAWF